MALMGSFPLSLGTGITPDWCFQLGSGSAEQAIASQVRSHRRGTGWNAPLQRCAGRTRALGFDVSASTGVLGEGRLKQKSFSELEHGGTLEPWIQRLLAVRMVAAAVSDSVFFCFHSSFWSVHRASPSEVWLPRSAVVSRARGRIHGMSRSFHKSCAHGRSRELGFDVPASIGVVLRGYRGNNTSEWVPCYRRSFSLNTSRCECMVAPSSSDSAFPCSVRAQQWHLMIATKMHSSSLRVQLSEAKEKP